MHCAASVLTWSSGNLILFILHNEYKEEYFSWWEICIQFPLEYNSSIYDLLTTQNFQFIIHQTFPCLPWPAYNTSSVIRLLLHPLFPHPASAPRSLVHNTYQQLACSQKASVKVKLMLLSSDYSKLICVLRSPKSFLFGKPQLTETQFPHLRASFSTTRATFNCAQNLKFIDAFA